MHGVDSAPMYQPSSAAVLAKTGHGAGLPLYGGDTSHAARQSFAYIFTATMLSIYSGPVILALQLGADPDVAYWIGRYGQLAAFVPLWFVMMHMVMMTQLAGEEKKVRKNILMWTAILPAIILAFSGGLYMSSSRWWSLRLTNEDCGPSGNSQGKAELQEAYEVALDMYKECRQNMLEANGGVEPRWRPTLQSCSEWARLSPVDEESKAWKAYSRKAEKADKNFHTQFEYLASVEANHVCGGFCQPGPMLWNDYDVIGKQGSRCAPMLGTKFQVTHRQGLQLLVISLAGMSVFFFIGGVVDKFVKPFLSPR